MIIEITAPYAAILGLIGLVLSVQVSIHRGKSSVSLGDGGDTQLLVKIRRFGNFIENVPLALILMALAETVGLSAMWLHVAGGILILSRLIHPLGLDPDRPAAAARIIGSISSKVAMLIPIVAILLNQFAG